MKSANIDRIVNVLRSFDAITLDELPNEVLMERIDRKFAMNIGKVEKLIAGLASHYKVITVDGRVVSKYESVYFDTSAYDFYGAHQRGFKNRVKVRYRSYPETETTFFEVKRKNNKRFTSKERIPATEMKWPFDPAIETFIEGQLPESDLSDLSPSVQIDYDRIGFISHDKKERFSLDFNIRFSRKGVQQAFHKLAILEVKQATFVQSPVVRALRKAAVEEQSLSKYCLALSRSVPTLRANNFKPVLRRIEKITHE